MKIAFSKYQGTGNDFVIIDQRDHKFLSADDREKIEFLCDRRFGIGADGLILLEKSQETDFRMIYFNADGRQSSMCGNGGRCIVHFAHSVGIIREKYLFEAIDGIHEAFIISQEQNIVRLKMNDVTEVKKVAVHEFELNTGSPHYVIFTEVIPEDVNTEGKKIRYSAGYKEYGINVNFCTLNEKYIEVATYERGVEAETFSCGTGVTAAAIASSVFENKIKSPVRLNTKGGTLLVEFENKDSTYINIWLSGPATPVFRGEIEV